MPALPQVPRKIKQHWLYKLTFLGFNAGPVKMRKLMMALMLTQLLFGIGCFYVYYSYNGGLIPWFLRSDHSSKIYTNAHALYHFPESQGDGSRLTWVHAVNSKDRLNEVLKGDAMMVEGDVLLRGQGTKNQQLVPIMAHPPDVNSDLTLDEWVQTMKHTGKGLKLDFKSIEAVELSLQSLQAVKKELHGPVWLNGDILPGPNTESRPIDWQRFLRLCQEHFPESTISLGWKTGYSSIRTRNAYTWAMVKAMHDVLDKWHIKQPVTFAVRASYMKYSLPQLQWLMEMTGATLTVFSPDQDEVPVSDLMYIRRKLHKDQVYFDLPDSLKTQFDSVKDQTDLGGKRGRAGDEETGAFSVTDWILARGEKGETIFLGSEAVILQRGQLLSKGKYSMDHIKMLQIVGRIQFIPSLEPGEEVSIVDKEDFSLEIYLHVLQGARPSAISGIRCAISPSGRISVGTKSVPGTDSESSATFKGAISCADLYIEELPSKGVLMKVTQLEECNSLSPAVVDSLEVKLTLADLQVDGEHVAIRGVGKTSFVAIPRFQIHLSDHL